ncbi:MAG: TolC family protein [Candidatus Glassbacteria bacterium]|nr:TolC family protein [Candidatus Glassbacteria bacterium]
MRALLIIFLNVFVLSQPIPGFTFDLKSDSSDSISSLLTLEEAIRTALANNPDLAAAKWDAVAAQARRNQAAGERLPRLSMVDGYAHHVDVQRLLPVRQPGDPSILSRDIVSGDLVISLPLFTGGRLVNQVRAAELLRQAAEHRLAHTSKELVFNVSSVFFSILAQRHVIESLEFSQHTLEEHLKRVEALVEAQKAARVDLMRTEVRLADVSQRLVQERNVAAIQRRALANLLGMTEHDRQLSLQGDLESEEKVMIPDSETALEMALAARDDYLSARSALEAQSRNVDVAKAGHWPTIALQGAYGARWAAGPKSGSGKSLDDIGRVGLAIELPLFEGGKVDARVQEESADYSAALERLRKIELQVRYEVEAAQLNISSARERSAAIQKAIDQAGESLRIEQQKYELGKGAIVDVLDAQAALLESQTNYFRVLAELHTAKAQFRLATGEER